jgi:hypothetical protein
VGPDRLFDRVANYGHMWGLRDRTCVVFLGDYLARAKLVQIIVALMEMSDSCLLLSFHSNSTFIMLLLLMGMILTTL